MLYIRNYDVLTFLYRKCHRQDNQNMNEIILKCTTFLQLVTKMALNIAIQFFNLLFLYRGFVFGLGSVLGNTTTLYMVHTVNNQNSFSE